MNVPLWVESSSLFGGCNTKTTKMWWKMFNSQRCIHNKWLLIRNPQFSSKSQVEHSNQSTTLTTDKNYTCIFFQLLIKFWTEPTKNWAHFSKIKYILQKSKFKKIIHNTKWSPNQIITKKAGLERFDPFSTTKFLVMIWSSENKIFTTE